MTYVRRSKIFVRLQWFRQRETTSEMQSIMGRARVVSRYFSFAHRLHRKRVGLKVKTTVSFQGLIDSNKTAARILCLNLLETPAKTPKTLFNSS